MQIGFIIFVCLTAATVHLKPAPLVSDAPAAPILLDSRDRHLTFPIGPAAMHELGGRTGRLHFLAKALLDSRDEEMLHAPMCSAWAPRRWFAWSTSL